MKVGRIKQTRRASQLKAQSHKSAGKGTESQISMMSAGNYYQTLLTKKGIVNDWVSRSQ